MQKSFVWAIGATIVAVATLLGVCLLCSTVKTVDLFQENVEALTRSEGLGKRCTGPKGPEDGTDEPIYCQCSNTQPCRDTYGC